MHASSLENMQKCYERYICGDYLASSEGLMVLDIGGANVNGTYADIFSQEKFKYTAADISPSVGVDVVLDDPYRLPFDDTSVDIVISGQAFEHVEFFWLLFVEMSRVVKDNGWIFLIAPSGGPIHRYPVDCYRFYPDAYAALAKYGGVNLIGVHHDDRGPWNDLVGVFSKMPTPGKDLPEEWRPLDASEMNRYLSDRIPVATDVDPRTEEMERVSGEAQYLKVLSMLHDALNPKLYLEIGVRRGSSLALAKCSAIAIDPDPEISGEAYSQVDLFRMPSDHYFERHWPLTTARQLVDFAFIDGMHLFEFVLRDFINLEARMSAGAVIAVDDIFPNHPVQAERRRETRVWTGDVWKFLICLRECRPDLELTMVDTSPTGLLIIRGLNRNNRTLVNRYNPIVRKYGALQLDDYRGVVLERQDAVSPSSEAFAGLLEKIRLEVQRRRQA